MALEAKDATPFQPDKISRNYWKVCSKFLNIYTQIYQKKKKKKNLEILNFNFFSSCLSLPLFDFRLKSHYLEKREPKPTVSFIHLGWPPGCNSGIQGGWMKPYTDPQRPHATPFRPNWTAHHTSLKMCTLHTDLTVQNGPWPIKLLAEDAAILHMRPALGMECLTIYPLNIGVNLKKKHRLPQTSSKISLVPHKIPRFCPKFQFSLTGKVFLILDFPVWVGTLISYLVMYSKFGSLVWWL